MTKQEVAEKNLSQYVVMPEGSDLSFMLRWNLLVVATLCKYGTLTTFMD